MSARIHIVCALFVASACNSGGSLPERDAADSSSPDRFTTTTTTKPTVSTTTGGRSGSSAGVAGSINLGVRFDAGMPKIPDDDDASVGPDGFCEAPLPTGFCWVSDKGDYIGGGRTRLAKGEQAVRLSGAATVSATLTSDDGQSMLHASFAAGQDKELELGHYSDATRWPFNTTNPGLDVSGDGRGCNRSEGEFTVRELALDPTSGMVSRFSAVFEQHCEGGAAALRGMVNYQANGKPDVPIVAVKTVPLLGKVSRMKYEPSTHTAYGLDFTNRKVVKVNLSDGHLQVSSVVQVPNDCCVDVQRKRLFVVNKSSTIISELDLESLDPVREITWAPADSTADATHFHIECARDRLYVVDAAQTPGLFTVENLDSDAPTVTDHTKTLSGVGGLVLNEAQDELYYWHQQGWNAGSIATAVRRVKTAGFSVIDESKAMTSDGFVRDPLDAPILLDETRKLVFSKNLVFDALNLGKVIYTLPGKAADSLQGAPENTYALSVKTGLIASHGFVYELERYDVVTPTLTKRADHMFFDRDGLLWFLTTATGKLEAQKIERK